MKLNFISKVLLGLIFFYSFDLVSQSDECNPDCQITWEQIRNARNPEWIRVLISEDCQILINKKRQDFLDEDKRNFKRLKNVACSYAAGWVENIEGECPAGGPPPCCKVQHWHQNSNAIEIYNSINRKVCQDRYAILDEIYNKCEKLEDAKVEQEKKTKEQQQKKSSVDNSTVQKNGNTDLNNAGQKSNTKLKQGDQEKKDLANKQELVSNTTSGVQNQNNRDNDNMQGGNHSVTVRTTQSNQRNATTDVYYNPFVEQQKSNNSAETILQSVSAYTNAINTEQEKREMARKQIELEYEQKLSDLKKRQEALAKAELDRVLKAKENVIFWKSKVCQILNLDSSNFIFKKPSSNQNTDLNRVFYILWSFNSANEIQIFKPFEINKSIDGDWLLVQDLFAKIYSCSKVNLNTTPDKVITKLNELNYLLGYFESANEASIAYLEIIQNAKKIGHKIIQIERNLTLQPLDYDSTKGKKSFWDE